uniref:Uncharacterized protein n=1 Tax=Caenorhabditis tropicalis TaxID=1561998 RepID=A0A1I7TSH7_9PELO
MNDGIQKKELFEKGERNLSRRRRRRGAINWEEEKGGNEKRNGKRAVLRINGRGLPPVIKLPTEHTQMAISGLQSV